MSSLPAHAEPFSDRLAALAPVASHLAHMPSHTDYWIGRYQHAVDVNVHAAIDVANARRVQLSKPKSVWNLAYHPHNTRFGLRGRRVAAGGREERARAQRAIHHRGVATTTRSV